MAKTKNTDLKRDVLKEQACLNPHPHTVADPLFASSDFFDKRDLVQVKYEMVRRVLADGDNVSRAATTFGFSRPSFYQAQAALEREGLAGLVPKKRGPRHAHKLSEEVVAFILELLAQDVSLTVAELASGVWKRFKLRVHPRSIERALARKEKK